MNRFSALCSPGLEHLPAREIRYLGLRVIETWPGRVIFEAEAEGLCRCLLGLRTADRILWLIGDFRASALDQLFEHVQAHAWELFVPAQTFPVIQKVRLGSDSPHSPAVLQATLHKAILQRLAQKMGTARLPSYTAQSFLRIYGHSDRVEVGLDLTPEPLSHRGYRLEAMGAPLRETVAAALVLWSGFKRGRAFWDPMCGNGTILAEAVLWLMDRAPNRDRQFDLPPALGIEEINRKRAREYWVSREIVPNELEMGAADRDPRALQIAKDNLGRLGLPRSVLEKIRWEKADLGRSQPPGPAAWLLTNPPWGERLEDTQTARSVLRDLGQIFHHQRLGCLGVLSAQSDSEKLLSLARIQRLFFRNGGIPVQMLVAKGQVS